MEKQDIRLKQRFQNFEKAFFKLKEAMEVIEPYVLEKNGLVQRFEFTLELSWKVMKDFLEEKGFKFIPLPKDTFRQGSDIDLAIINKGVSDSLLRKIKNDFEECRLPFKVDLVNFPTLVYSEFIEHIVRVGVGIYNKTNK